MIKLYTSAAHARQWIAYAPDFGWVLFPNKENGWEERRQARGLDPLHLRSVPLHLAAKTGILQHGCDLVEVA